MRRPAWWLVLALAASVATQAPVPTVCEDEACRCDAFTRVICNCTSEYTELTLRPDGAYRVPSTATGIIVDGCARVAFLPDTVRHLPQLRRVELRNVKHAVIGDRALAWAPFATDSENNPGLHILVHNSTVDEIASHAIQGRVDDITITDSTISNIKPFAFSSLTGMKSVELTDNVFGNIEIQAFKKFSVENFLLRGGRVKTLPSRFLSDVEVTNLFRMEGVTVSYLYSLTFLVNGPKRVLIENNNIDTLEGDGFHMTTRGPITFRNNTVRELRKGAFFGFTVDLDVARSAGAQELLIDNNTVTHVGPGSFIYNRTRLTMRLDGLNFNQSCACEMAEHWRAIVADHGAVSCWYELEGHYVSLPTYVDSRCGAFKQNYWIFVLIGVILLLLIVAVVIFFIVRRENEKKKKVQIVMPDGKTYRETEFHIVVERAELLTTDL